MLLFDQIARHALLRRRPQGGQPLLWQHLFWFFGHPEVYILILPAMGLVSDIIANGSRKPIFGYHVDGVRDRRASAFLGWIVWGHHMFMSGMNPTLGTSFMISTMLIAVPSAIKVFNWLGTLWRGNIRFHVPMLHAHRASSSMFMIGGLSRHLHGGDAGRHLHPRHLLHRRAPPLRAVRRQPVRASSAAITFWFPKMFGRMMNEVWGKMHFWLTFIFYNWHVLPDARHRLAGHMRRIYDPTSTSSSSRCSRSTSFISICAFLLFASQIIFVVNFFVELVQGEEGARRIRGRPTGSSGRCRRRRRTATSETLPTVYRGPYEFSSPRVEPRIFSRRTASCPLTAIR